MSQPANDENQKGLPYVWRQTLSEVTISVPVPQGTRAKQLDVNISHNHLKVGLKGQDSIINDDLFAPVRTDESTWTIEDSKELVIVLEKRKGQEWWPHVVVSAPKIDVTKIQPENSKLSDLDGETRAMVEKMMFDNQQKQLGKPTSDELKKQELFAKFKSQHPEMDFSQVKDVN